MCSSLWAHGVRVGRAGRLLNHPKGRTGRSRYRTACAAALASAVMIAGLTVATPAYAQTLVGCSTADLVTAIMNANSSGGGTLDLTPGCDYTLTTGPYGDNYGANGLPVITSAITIIGNGDTIARNPSAPAFRLIEVASGNSLVAEDLTLSHGDETSGVGGGALYNLGTVTLTDSTVSDNAATADGGAIYDLGTVTLTDSTVSGNSASAGGGIENTGPVILTNSTMSGNSASYWGGGIMNDMATVTLTNSTVSGNSATGMSFGGGQGGGVINFGTLTLTDSTVANNSALGSFSQGGGIDNVGTVTLTSSIVANSSGGGDCYGAITTDGGYNLDSDGSCGLTLSSDKSHVNPDLLALGAYGGPTLTMEPQASSPTIDAIPPGTNGCGTTITSDQRGVRRPQGPECDIGAVEVEAEGLLVLDASGGVAALAGARFLGAVPLTHRHRLVALAVSNVGKGYYVADNTGGVYAFGTAVYDNSPTGDTKVVAIAVTRDSGGYWLLDKTGVIHSFGDARHFSSLSGGQFVALAPTPDGGGMWVLDRKGEVFALDDASFYGSAFGLRPFSRAVSLVATPDGKGYWLAEKNGRVLDYGDAGNFGSCLATCHLPHSDPVVAMTSTPDGLGYWLVTAGGSIFAFGDAHGFGPAPATVVAAASTP